MGAEAGAQAEAQVISSPFCREPRLQRPVFLCVGTSRHDGTPLHRYVTATSVGGVVPVRAPGAACSVPG